MSVFRSVAYERGGTPTVKRTNAEIEGLEIHSIEIAIGGALEISLTQKEAKDLFDSLGEILVPESPEEIATRISTQKTIGGFSGIQGNTRRIIQVAVLQAVKAARGLPERSNYIHPADRVSTPEERGEV